MTITIALKTVVCDSEIKEIGVIADTHIPSRALHMPRRLIELLAGVQLILHAGDLVDEKVLEELRAIAPVEAVAGNMDPMNLKKSLGRLKLIKLGPVAIGLLHGDSSGHNISFDRVSELFHPAQLQAVVFGHLHEPMVKVNDGILYFNPGSATDPRRASKPSCGRLLISGSQISGEILYL